jgi:hypothetical protein
MLLQQRTSMFVERIVSPLRRPLQHPVKALTVRCFKRASSSFEEIGTWSQYEWSDKVERLVDFRNGREARHR